MVNPWSIPAAGWAFLIAGWWLSPISSWLLQKLFAYLDFEAAKELRDLEIHTVPALKATLRDVEEQRMVRAARDDASRCDLDTLDKMDMDLKSDLWEAEDILDNMCYRQHQIHFEDDASVWVENQHNAACAWIARCKGSWFGRWIQVVRVGVMKCAQSMTWLGQFLIQGLTCFVLLCIPRAVNTAGAAVLLCAQSWYQQLVQVFRSGVLECGQSWYRQLEQLFRRVILGRSGVLPVSTMPTRQPPHLDSRGSVFAPTPTVPTRRPAEEMLDEEETVEATHPTGRQAEEMVDEEEIVEETQVTGRPAEETVDEEELVEETQQVDGGELGETSEEETEEGDEEGKQGEPKPTSLSMFRYCARSMLTWYAKACFYRDWSYGIVGIKNDKKDGNVPIRDIIRLRKQIKGIQDILSSVKKSNLLNHNSSSSTGMDANQESRSIYTIKNSDKECSSKQKEIDDLHGNIEQSVIGREKDRDDIIRMLCERPEAYAATSSASKPYSVIGIYGISGSGKSTLAKYVCHHEKVTRHFDPIVFINVGTTFSVGNIFRDMLEKITLSRPSNDKDLKSLKIQLEEKLIDKRFLLVLDDVWVNDENQKERDILLDTLNIALSGSRVLVTAQKKDAAEDLGAKKQISIPDLEEKVYLSLFMHHARPEGANNDYGEYERIGRKIANRLHRSPIAAVTVGKQLRRNKSISLWETTADLDVLNKTMGALWWSYQQLGVDIRRCFAYCSTFPKGYVLKRDELVLIWIAQGFVSTGSNATEKLEGIGQSYLEELMRFSFIQKLTNKYFGDETVLFTVHDLLHELATRVSGSEFLGIGLSGSPKNIPVGIRHIFIETNNGAVILEKVLVLKNLRTLIIKEPYARPGETMEENHDIEKVLERLFMKLTKLRVLIIKINCGITKLSVPASIDQMKHLRYLGFHNHRIFHVILPRTFRKLYLIQTIDIPCLQEPCRKFMANLIYLRNICTPLSFLNSGSFEVKEYGLKQLMHLNTLQGILGIRIDGLQTVGSKVEVLEAQLTDTKLLRILILNFGPDKRRAGPDVQAEVLESLCPPVNLQELTISWYKGSRYPTWMLSRHPDAPKQLHVLVLINCSQLESIPEDSELFIGLRQLCIHTCDWESLPENMERLVLLQTLEIRDCNKIELLPTLPHQSLKRITIGRCEVLSKTCKEEGHRNFTMIQDIPEKEIYGDIM